MGSCGGELWSAQLDSLCDCESIGGGVVSLRSLLGVLGRNMRKERRVGGMI